ncbi:MAG TPA: VOC family protein [Candidatus Saccharimonadales bacterium]|nr:VOC family protein [Candidatus Saccharimonadales bacterium]
MSLNLNSLMISSENPEKLVEFYTKVLGKPTWDMKPFTGWSVGSCGIMVGPHSEVHGKNDTPGRLIFFFETTDVKGEFDRIKGLGAEVVSEPAHPSGDTTDQKTMLACLADPDGNYFQLATPWEEPKE